MSIELVPLCTVAVRLADAFILPDTPVGTRAIAEVTSFELTGDRLTGHLKGNAAADWLTISPAFQGTLDVRALIETDDGALIFTSYRGRMDLSAGPDAATVYSTPLFDTGDERYAWINGIQAVAKGKVGEAGARLDYEMYELR